jgi:4-hydroxybutyrate CoA-transferase
MDKWKEMYATKRLSAEALSRKFNSYDRCVSNGQVVEPEAILEALTERARRGEIEGLEYHILAPQRHQSYLDPELSDKIHLNALFVSRPTIDLVWDGYADYLPSFYLEISKNLSERGDIDVFMTRVSPMDKHGYFSFGAAADLSEMHRTAKRVYLEVNPTVPRVLGNCFIHISEVDFLCESDTPISERYYDELSEEDIRIGEIIAREIPDGACIQLGLGSMPNAIVKALMDKKNLGIHSEMFTDGMMELIEAGVVNNSKKSIHVGKSIASFTNGSRRLYDFLDDNPGVEFHPVNYTNDPMIIGRNDNVRSINSCIEVDLFGQVCAETIGPKHFSGVGGQVDFVRGAKRSKGGKSIIAMNSTAKNGTISKVKTVLTKGAVVTTSRNDVDTIVTEYGIARMRGKTYAERARELISIAHPKFREELEKEARDMNIISKNGK